MEVDKKKILVTGGAGFIGSHLSEALLKLGARVFVLDNFDDFYPGKESNVQGLLKEDRFTLVQGSILDSDTLLESMKGTDAVVHLAGQAGIRYCNEWPFKANEVNARGTLNVLLSCRKQGVKKVVYASSSAVYGDPVRTPMDELHPTDPNNLYGATKLAAEKYCTSFARAYGMEITSLRFFSVYGPRGRPDQVLYSFAEKASKGEPPTIYGDGSYSRDFTFISDVISATFLALYRDLEPGKVMNIGFGKDYKVIDIAKKVMEHYGLQGEPRFVKKYEGDFVRTLCNNQVARTSLGWRPEVALNDGLAAFLDWFDANKPKGSGTIEQTPNRVLSASEGR